MFCSWAAGCSLLGGDVADSPFGFAFWRRAKQALPEWPDAVLRCVRHPEHATITQPVDGYPVGYPNIFGPPRTEPRCAEVRVAHVRRGGDLVTDVTVSRYARRWSACGTTTVWNLVHDRRQPTMEETAELENRFLDLLDEFDRRTR